MVKLLVPDTNEETIVLLEALKNDEVEIQMTKCDITDDRIFAALGDIRKIKTLDLTDTQLSVAQFNMLLTNCRNIETLILTNTINLMKRYHDPNTIPKDHPELKKVTETEKAGHKMISLVGMFASSLRSIGLLTAPKPQLLLEDKCGDAKRINQDKKELNSIVESAKSVVTILSNTDIHEIAFRDMLTVFKALGSWLAENNVIQSLTFSKNIDDSARGALAYYAMRELAAGLKLNQSVTTLDLSENNIDEHGFDELATFFATDQHAPIHTLNLNGNIIGMNATQAFEKMFSNPRCTIQHLSVDKRDDPQDGSHPIYAIFSIASALKKSANDTLVTISALGEEANDDFFFPKAMELINEVLQNNRTLQTIALTLPDKNVEKALTRNRPTSSVRMRPY